MAKKIITLFVIVIIAISFSNPMDTEDMFSADPRNRIVGTANQMIGEISNNLTLTKDFGHPDGIVLYGFDDVPYGINAELNGSRLSIPKQMINNEEIEGEGIISEDFKSIYFLYTNDGIRFTTLIELNDNKDAI